MKTKIVFVLDSFGKRQELKAQSWEEVDSELYQRGIVNVGDVRVYKEEYHLICTTPQIINTNF